MKKVLSMLLFVAAASFATSCDEIEDLTGSVTDDLEDLLGDLLGNETDDMTLYNGTVSVSNGYEVGDDVKVYASEEDGEIKITIVEAKFNSEMPTIDITLSDIAIDSMGEFGEDSISPIVVMEYEGVDVSLSGDAVSAYTVTNLNGSYSESALDFSFTCMGCFITFNGTAE